MGMPKFSFGKPYKKPSREFIRFGAGKNEDKIVEEPLEGTNSSRIGNCSREDLLRQGQMASILMPSQSLIARHIEPLENHPHVFAPNNQVEFIDELSEYDEQNDISPSASKQKTLSSLLNELFQLILQKFLKYFGLNV